MFVLDSPNLPATAYPDSPSLISLFESPGVTDPIGIFRVGAAPVDALLVSLAPISNTGNTYTLALPSTFTRLDSLTYGGQVFRPAVDQTNPQPGEYVASTLNHTIQVVTNQPIQPGTQFLASTLNQSVLLQNQVLTDLNRLPDIFRQYQITGTISWGNTWEGHPTANFTLVCNQADISAIKAALQAKKTTVIFYGMRFEVDTLNVETDFTTPDPQATIQVSLRGGWERLLEEAVVIDSATAPLTSKVSGVTFQDYNGIDTIGNTTTPVITPPAGSRTIRGDCTVQDIAARIGAVVDCPPNSIQSPREAGQEQLTTLQDAFKSQLRHEGHFADYAFDDAIRSVPIDGVKLHQIFASQVISTKMAIAVQAYPRAVDYKNCPLQWGTSVSETSTYLEDTQGKAYQNSPPRWRLKPPERKYTPTGSDLSMPSDAKTITDASLIFDNGGPTRERRVVMTEDGATVKEFFAKRGFMAVACDSLYTLSVDSNYKITWALRTAILPSDFWADIENTETEYFYDPETGYLIYTQTTGWRWTRLNSESGNESLTAYATWYALANPAPSAGPPDSTKTQAALDNVYTYRYEKVAVNELHIYNTALFRDFYKGIASAPTEEYEITLPEFLPDGSLNPDRLTAGDITGRTTINGKSFLTVKQSVRVPGWTDPQFCTQELGRKNAFLSRPNPKSTAALPLPPLVAGEDSVSEKATYVPNYRDSEHTAADGSWQETETFIEFNSLISQKDAKFARGAKDITLSQNQGRPGEHTRKVPKYEKINPAAKPSEQKLFDYFVSSIPYPDARIKGNTLSYPYAHTEAEALVGASTDMLIQNGRGTETMSLDIAYRGAIRAGDLVDLEGQGRWWVVSCRHEQQVHGPGVLEYKASKLQLGRFIPNPDFTVERRKIVQTAKGSGTTTTYTSPNPGDLAVGRTRGNPEGS